MQVLIGIIASLIVFPINLIVVQIFRNVRPKPKVRPKKPPPRLPTLSFTKENLENYNQLKESSDESTKGSNNSLDSSREKNNRTRLSINDVHTDMDRASFTDSPLLIDRRLSTTYEIGMGLILVSKATFTGDRTGTVPSRTGPDRLLFTRDRSGTGPERIQNWNCKKAGPILDPEQFRVNKRPI